MSNRMVDGSSAEIHGSVFDAALFYARSGWPVFPLHPASKRPLGVLVPHGLKDATTDVSLVRHWWTSRPDANAGIKTGAESGIVALDIDPRHGGDHSLVALQVSFGELPSTATSLTGGGGRHLLLKHPGIRIPNSTSKIAPGVDVRGDGGYIVAPPSIHSSGSRYCWGLGPEAAPPVQIPAWLLGLMLVGKLQSVPSECASASRPIKEGSTGYRNETLFERSRFFAYRAVSRCQSESELRVSVRSYAVQVNHLFRIPLGDDEVQNIVKSVSSKVWPFRDHFIDSLGNRGAMKLEPISWLPSPQQHRCEIQRRQRLGARFAAKSKQSKTDARIASAVVILNRLGSPITISSVARTANLDRITVWRHLGGLSGLTDLIASIQRSDLDTRVGEELQSDYS